jgi:carbamoyl-phosphate synthase large subunit
MAVRVMAGETLASLGFTEEIIPNHISVKEAVLPFSKFPGTDIILGPEMRSTGEVMGIDTDFGKAFAKAELGASQVLPLQGTVFVSINDRDKESVVPIVKDLMDLGLNVVATAGTRKLLQERGVQNVELVLKLHEGRPNVVDSIKNEKIQLIINTPIGEAAQIDDRYIRRNALAYKVPIVTTMAGARATAAAIRSLQSQPLNVKAIQDYSCSPVA